MNNNSKKIAYALYLPLFFPEGIAPGCGSTYNRLLLARNGQGHPVLRGTALAGALRHAYDAQSRGADAYFGSAKGQELKPSRLKFQDSRLILPDSIDYRTHHQRNRHTGVVLDGALFSLESCSPRTESETVLWLESDEETRENDREFLAQIVRFFSPRSGGFYVGGNVARGIGRAVLRKENPARLRVFDLSKPDDWAAWFTFRSGAGNCTEWDIFEPEKDQNQNRLTVQFTLTIPSGQDLLIADGDMAPQRVTGANGKIYWRIPGSTMRGLFRSFILRLASRAGKTIGDSIDKWQNLSKEEYTGDSLAWAFMDKLLKKTQLREDLKKYPVETLFGTAFQRGKIHFSDAYSPCGEQWNFLDNSLCEEEQRRMHVKIDPISGGAVPLALFSNTVLTSAKSPKFDFTMTVDQPTEEEAKWLAQTLRALDFGLLRLGTTKASGRVKLVSSPTASCPTNELLELYFTEISPSTDFESLQPVDDPFASLKAAETPQQTGSNWEPSILYFEGKIRKAQNPQKPDKKLPIYGDSQWLVSQTWNDGDEISIVREGGRITKICPRGKEAEAESSDTSTKQVKPTELGKFHNPYTFIKFESKRDRERKAPTLLTVDENNAGKDRFSGVIEMELQTLRPLLSIHPVSVSDKEPKEYKALTIGQDVIVPGTAIRGQLRNLMTILASSSINNMDENSWVYEKNRTTSTTDEQYLFLAEVVTPGDAYHSGWIRVAKDVKLVSRSELGRAYGNLKNLEEEYSKNNKERIFFKITNPDEPDPEKRKVERFDQQKDPISARWELRLSGPAVKGKPKADGSPAVKKDALFRPGQDAPIEISSSKWTKFASINASGVHRELRNGDVVWLEITPDFRARIDSRQARTITSEADIMGFQWTRWGKDGRKYSSMVSEEFHPCTIRKDRLVDMVTDLFGQVSDTGDKNCPAFMGRIRPENLVFKDGINNLEKGVELSPLMGPHPGCFQFYQQKGNFRGYKVYRNGLEGEEAWLYSNQGVFGDDGHLLKFDSQNLTKKVDLLKSGQKGHLRISFRALNRRELAFLCEVCKSVWRLGGGKPLGLGLCKTTHIAVLLWNDDDKPYSAPEDLYQIQDINDLYIKNRLKTWLATQIPVSNVHYPRAVKTTNRNSTETNYQRGGHSWFSVFSTPKKSDSDKLQSVTLAESYCKEINFKERELEGQSLPDFKSSNPEGDVLYGYDVLLDVVCVADDKNNYRLSLFDDSSQSKHENEKEHPNNSQNRESRNAWKRGR